MIEWTVNRYLDNVNVDINELTDFSQKVRTAINSIEISKSGMLKKYQQLGETWNDKKYRELGVIVQECNKAFNEILKTLYVSDKFLKNLVKSINEYEKINFYNESSVNDASIIGYMVNAVANTLSSEVKEWKSKLDELSQRLENYYRENYSTYISEEKISRPLSDTVRYETQELFHSRGMQSGVLGYNDGVRSHIAVGTGHELQTTVHENLHQLSANGSSHGIIQGSGSSRRNVQMNEAITEMLTQRTLGDDYGPDYSAYSENRDAMLVLEHSMGGNIISQAYFQNQPEIMQNAFERVMGYGSWNELSEAFDDCVSRYPHTRVSGRIRRDELINRFSISTSSNGGNDLWTNMLL